jgi:hypothetical protein
MGVNRQGREPDHSRSSSAEVEMGGAIVPIPHARSWSVQGKIHRTLTYRFV